MQLDVAQLSDVVQQSSVVQYFGRGLRPRCFLMSLLFQLVYCGACLVDLIWLSSVMLFYSEDIVQQQTICSYSLCFYLLPAPISSHGEGGSARGVQATPTNKSQQQYSLGLYWLPAPISNQGASARDGQATPTNKFKQQYSLGFYWLPVPISNQGASARGVQATPTNK